MKMAVLRRLSFFDKINIHKWSYRRKMIDFIEFNKYILIQKNFCKYYDLTFLVYYVKIKYQEKKNMSKEVNCAYKNIFKLTKRKTH